MLASRRGTNSRAPYSRAHHPFPPLGPMPPRKSALAAVAAALLTSTACFHAVVETGRPAGTTVVQKPWVNTFVFGLVAAQPIDVSAQCPGGLAKVETQMSVPNALVSFVTLGLYTPRTA